MAYIPPHKRHSRGGGSSSTSMNPSPPPAPTPESLSQHFNRSLNFESSSKKNKNRDRNRGAQKIIYAPNAISKWFPVGLASTDDDDDDDQLMSMTRLEPFSVESLETKFGEKPLALVLNHDRLKEYGEDRRVFLENPWLVVAEKVKQDLLSALQRFKDEINDNESEQVKPTLVARIGRVLFHGGQSTLSEQTLRQKKRSFNTAVSPSYVEHIVNDVILKLRTDFVGENDFVGEKELYHVKLSDNMQPDSTISCKCTLAEDGKKIELYKIEWNQVRHLVADMSCLDKSLDLRLMLSTKRIVKALTDDEMKCIKFLIGSAILDPEVKGGLRWPLGTDTSGDRYSVVGVWHTNAKSFRNSSLRLKVRRADRFDFRSSSGEVSREVTLSMYGIVSHWQEQPMQDDQFTEMLKSNLKLIWDNFLCFAPRA